MASGQSSRRAPCRRRCIRRTITAGRKNPNPTKQPATAIVLVMATTRTSAIAAQSTWAPSSCPGPTPSTPAWRSRSRRRSNQDVEARRRAGAREPLRQISRSPSPASRPRKAPTSALPRSGQPIGAVPERVDQVDPGRLVAVRVRREALGPFEAPATRGENLGRLDDVAFHASGDAEDLADPALTGRIQTEVHDEVNARGD